MAKRILLADDSITIQKVVELTFSDGDYEVTAVNNGTKAIQQLSDMRPDIILSDIIMPEKNGYEVCEYVKSHPEFRNIPVILLTGTFEPFDPDRADKAGCDAVVTKPFESQSLIHKVEELIEHAKTQAPTAPGEPFAPQAEEPKPAAPSDSFATGTFPSHGEIFAGAGAVPPPPPPAAETPFEQQPTGGETRALPRMSFDELQRMSTETSAPPPPAPQAASPWDEPAPSVGETRAFPRMTFDDPQKAAEPAPPAPAPVRPSQSTSPWDELPATGGETRAFPRMSFDELHQAAAAPPTPPPPPRMPEAPPWDSTPHPGAAESAPQEPESLPWNERELSYSGETRAFPRMTFEELEKSAAPPPPAMPEPAVETAPPPPPAMEEMPFKHEPEPRPVEEPAQPQPAPAAAAAGELTDEQIDRIARRVVQLISEQVVRNIAWEVIPDLAETVVKERIRQLESE